MPFKSDKQRKWMHANEPEMAKKWEKEEAVMYRKRATPIQKIEKLAKANKYGEVDGMRMNGKTAKTIMKVYNHPKIKPFHRKLDAFRSDEIIDVLLNLTKVLGIKEDRDYKAEYKKYGSSTKAKKYRAELNQYNRKKGTYGNGDGKDASHKGGKIVGFEKESKNRGRAEKSRLKQETVNEVGELISKPKVRLLKMNAKYLADDLMDMYKELGRKHADISPALIIQHLDTLKDKVKMMRKNVGLRESVNEKISKEEWAEYPKWARKLKPYMKRLLKIPVRVRVIKQANHNPWIDVRVARYGKDVIPNDFRKRALKVTGGGRPRDMDNINYGNITAGSVSMKHDQWVKLLGNKVK